MAGKSTAKAKQAQVKKVIGQKKNKLVLGKNKQAVKVR